MLISGAISCKAALTYKRRTVYKLYAVLNKHSHDFTYIINLAQKANIPSEFITDDALNALVGNNKHGGIAAEVSSRRYETLHDLSDRHLFIIEGIEDPFNLGYALRSLKAFGYHDLILAKRDYHTSEATILKSSAGAFEMLNVILAEDLLETIKYLKSCGYHCSALSRQEKAADLFTYSFKEKEVFILGGEKRGINKQLLKEVDSLLVINYPSDFRMALNATAALDVFLTVLEYQRRHDH